MKCCMALIAGILSGFTSLSSNAQAATDPAQGDIRDLTVGLSVADLPVTGYARFTCSSENSEPETTLSGWSDYPRCPADAAGLHEVSVQYDDSLQPWAQVNDKWEGTKVAGHPVRLSVLINTAGVVQGLRVLTDPAARKYLRKKAYLLSFKVKSRYGAEGWQCVRQKPAHGETPVGGVYINEHCEKTSGSKHLVLDTRLYRSAEQDLQDFTNSTRFEIWLGTS